MLSSRLWNNSNVLGWGCFGGMADPRRSFRRQVNHSSKSKETPSRRRARNRKLFNRSPNKPCKFDYLRIRKTGCLSDAWALFTGDYVSIKYTERLAEVGIEPSVGSVGDSYDNALAETINGLYKTEVIRRRGSWRSLETVEFATLDWVDWFNNRRLFEPIGNIPPAEAEARYYQQIETLAMAA
jgi:hypothetical protein